MRGRALRRCLREEIWIMSTSKLRCEVGLSRHNLSFVTLSNRHSFITKASNGILK